KCDEELSERSVPGWHRQAHRHSARFGAWQSQVDGESTMAESDWLAEKFQEQRPQLKAVACRILGSNGEADDAIQEAWFRLTRSDVNSVENLGGWLTTVVARVCLDMLRSRKSRKEESLEDQHLKALETPRQANPAEEALLADSVGSALL